MSIRGCLCIRILCGYSLIRKTLVPESQQFLAFTAKSSEGPYSLVRIYNWGNNTLTFDKQKTAMLIKQYVSYVEIHGVYKEKGLAKNVFGHLPNEAFFTVMLAALVAVGSVAYSLGQKEGRLAGAFEIRTKQIKIDSLAKLNEELDSRIAYFQLQEQLWQRRKLKDEGAGAAPTQK